MYYAFFLNLDLVEIFRGLAQTPPALFLQNELETFPFLVRIVSTFKNI